MAVQSYIPIDWVNNTAPAINAANLNYMQEGIVNNNEAITEIESGTYSPLGSWEWDEPTKTLTITVT